MYNKIKHRVFEIIETASTFDTASKIFDIFIITLIILNTISVIVATFEIPEWLSRLLSVFENISITVFTLEYILRVWTADLKNLDMKPFKARLRYMVSFMALIDLLSILPFYIPFIIPIDLRVLRTLRIIRMFRLFKLNRYTTALADVAYVFKSKAYQLLSSMFVVLLLMIISSIIMYNFEYAAQPEVFSNAFSSFWWAIATITTVGYGDIYPITIPGKIISAVIALLGVALVAVPTGIISAGFTEIMQNKKDKGKKVTALIAVIS